MIHQPYLSPGNRDRGQFVLGDRRIDASAVTDCDDLGIRHRAGAEMDSARADQRGVRSWAR